MKNYFSQDNGYIIYNVTIKVVSSVAGEWLQWLLNEHIPEVMNTTCFTGYRVLKILDNDDNEGPAYAIQYSAISMDDYKPYLANYADNLRKKSFDKWGENFVAFRTVMEIVQ